MPNTRKAHGHELSGWGRIFGPGEERLSEDLEALTKNAVLTRGLGRSYGDSSLPPPSQPVVAATPLADRLLSFDAETGVLRAEAGFSLAELNRVFLPRGFFAPVTPGTKFVTLGGMVASDVHGKNHHRDGCIGEHVRELRVRVGDGRVVTCSRENEPDLFRATIGGMGLTGHILEVELQLVRVPSPWIWEESERIGSIEGILAALKTAGETWPFTVAWVDSLTSGKKLGRGILMRGRWATPEEAPRHPPKPKRRLAVPFECPSWVMSRLSLRVFNVLFYWKHLRRTHAGIKHPEAYFYPLDAILHWNRLYGRRGVAQYQCVLPNDAGRGALRELLELVIRHRGSSFLTVVKDCGAEGIGLLSFPKAGVSIALDLPVRDNTKTLIDALNEFVLRLGGRIYLTKDAFTRPEHFRAMEPRLEEWQTIRKRYDPEGKIRSAQSIRVLGDPP